MLIDRFNRKITNLRISVTDACNLNCFYCHKEGYCVKGSSPDVLSVEDIAEITKAFYELGIKKVKITGGEPLLRKDILDIISVMPDFEEISMTTNGTLLDKYAYELKDAGLNRVNISLDSLNPETYKKITGGELERVLSGLESAVNAGLTPVKLNMVVMKEVNEDEIDDMLEFTSKYNEDDVRVILQIIELLKLPELEDYYMDISSIEERIAKKAINFRIRSMQKRKQYHLGSSVVEFVKPVDNTEFCYNCNRIRITKDGKIKPCLMRNDNLVDVRGLKGYALKEKIFQAVNMREPYFKKKSREAR
ncbi:cyclic pyranopterin monophosphate synthase subunit MoaA [Archaeoglobus sulfaticallidus PM70-1]|uniref:Probable GTP 3',8-cyclase n=1 Tax=Archaeoglobus sulfaticallidus PM70-1 TaxID=387631 RepID=N0BGT3_9EURY|nr:GTP 3',8-cyclase MoaA [Archaeoglobus sulfaticallidus]AGK62223.1 cyclic pyranopterin monophosphate synthase subunit MoaA [Archaeoglobus sulfaticallidus PM70-1]